MINAVNGKRLSISAILFTEHRWSLPHIGLQNVCSSRFGVIPGVTDKNYITNSYHVHVTEEIDAFSKLKFESEFQKLSPGGAVSYVEVPDMQNNIPAVLSVMKFIYENIMYAELNTKSDYCEKCGYDGEIKVIEDESRQTGVGMSELRKQGSEYCCL